MHWQTAVANPSDIDATAAKLLDALERVRPIRAINSPRVAVGRWLIESADDGTIAEDTVTWLHNILLPRAA
jgi:hypothetical protein